jgi:hypothetical protein
MTQAATGYWTSFWCGDRLHAGLFGPEVGKVYGRLSGATDEVTIKVRSRSVIALLLLGAAMIGLGGWGLTKELNPSRWDMCVASAVIGSVIFVGSVGYLRDGHKARVRFTEMPQLQGLKG